MTKKEQEDNKNLSEKPDNRTLAEKLDITPLTDAETHKQAVLNLKIAIAKKELLLGKKLRHNEIAKFLVEIDHYKTMKDNQELYVYRNGIYVKEGKKLVGQIVEQICKDTVSNNYVNEIIGCLQRQNDTDRKLFDSDPNLIVIKNGILNIKEDTLTDHTPDHLSIKKYENIVYNKEAKCPTIIKFLEEICPTKEFRQTLIDFMAYCLLPHYKYHDWLILVGSGHNGKTTFINLLDYFLGEENTRSIDIQDLQSKKVLVKELFGKSANLVDDLSKKPLKLTGLLKSLTGEGKVTVDVKYKDAFTFKNVAKIICTCNKLPKTEDDSDAFFDRVKIVEFIVKFMKGDPDTDVNLLEKMTTEEEISGLLNLCIKTIKEITDLGRIRYPFTGDEMRDQYNRFSDPLSAYIFNNVVQDIERAISKRDLYTDFIKYAHKNKIHVLPSNVFSRHIKPQIVGLGGADGYIGKDRAWRGIRLKNEEEKQESKDLEEYL